MFIDEISEDYPGKGACYKNGEEYIVLNNLTYSFTDNNDLLSSYNATTGEFTIKANASGIVSVEVQINGTTKKQSITFTVENVSERRKNEINRCSNH